MKRNKENDVKIKSLFQPVITSLANPVKVSENETVRVGVVEQLTLSKTRATLELLVTNSEKTRAEILWALNSVSLGYSNNSHSNNSKLLRSMFFDIKTAKTFQIGLNKRRYFVNFRIAPYFKSILIEKIKGS